MSEEYHRLERPPNRVERSPGSGQDWVVGPKAQALGELAVGSVISVVTFLWIFLAVMNMGNGAYSNFGNLVDLFFAFVLGSLALPGLRLVVKGAGELVGSGEGARGTRRRAAGPAKRDEQQLLEAIERHGEVTPARVAMETTLTVAEADRKLHGLVEGGYLEVRVKDGKLVYSL